MIADAAAIIGAVAGVIAALAAVPAAIYSMRAFHGMKHDAQAAERRHLAQIRPHPLIENATLHPNYSLQSTTAQVRLSISNPGGAATMWTVFIQMGEFLFCRRAPVTAHYRTPPGGYEEVPSFSKRLPAAPGNVREVLASYAVDTDGHAWDLLSDQPTDQSAEDYFRQHLAPFGLTVDEHGKVTAL